MLLAHGVGSRGDLPLPFWMFTWAAALALGLSFVALGVLWTKPRLADAAIGRSIAAPPMPLPAQALLWLARAGALVLFLLALGAGLFGSDRVSDNLLPVTLYVTVWVGCQLVAGTVGDVWRAINPLTTLALGVESVARRFDITSSAPPENLGQFPAAAGLTVFLFLELAHPSGDSPRVLGWALLVHTIVVLLLAVRWGSSWVAEHEPFSALFSMIASMAPVHSVDGRLRLRPPMSGLANMAVTPGTLATLLIVLGGTTFDGFVESEAGRSLFGRPSGWSGAFTLTVGLVMSVLLVTALFGVGIRWTSNVTGLDPKLVTDKFTPSLVPIVFGYAIAHYAQLLVDEAQTFWFRLSDPAGQGWNLFGAADGTVDFEIISVTFVAWIQVFAILFGHIGAVLVAHDRSLELSPEGGDSLRSQYVMLLVMVAYSVLGLWLLLNA